MKTKVGNKEYIISPEPRAYETINFLAHRKEEIDGYILSLKEASDNEEFYPYCIESFKVYEFPAVVEEMIHYSAYYQIACKLDGGIK